MKHLIRWLNNERTLAELTEVPSWIARVFGARSRVSRVYLKNGYWCYLIDGDSVSYDIRGELNHARRWDYVEKIPNARLLSDDG